MLQSYIYGIDTDSDLWDGVCMICAYLVSVKGTDWTMVINASSPGKAKHECHRSVLEAWPDVPFTAMRARRMDGHHTSPAFRANAAYRGLPNLRCGDRVKVGESCGTVVDHDASANIVVLFDKGSRYGEIRLSVHPSEMEIL